MRTSTVISAVLHILIGVAALLWLLWYFIPLGTLFKGLMTLFIVLPAGWLLWKNYRHHKTLTSGSLLSSELPVLDTSEPLVLVCGEELDTLFQGRMLRKTAQGWWIRIDNISRLTEIASSILEQQPRQIGQLSVMYSCLPDQHKDEAILRASVKALRLQIKLLNRLIGFTLPVVLSCEFSGPQTPWIIVRGDKPIIHPPNTASVAFSDWQQTAGNISKIPGLKQAFSFIREVLLDELEKPDRLMPVVNPFAVAVRTGIPSTEASSIWAQRLYQRTCLQLPATKNGNQSVDCFPDAILPMLAPFLAPIQGGENSRRLVCLMWLCALVALGFSAVNNRGLIHQISADLQRWHAIPMTHYAPKALSLMALKQDVLLLERWHRQGEPMRYGLGYYPGQRLWLVLQQTIDTYIPEPAAIPKPLPKTVRLNSMSLFDSGQSVLKTGSAKMLINSLVDIKAKPGWLIVVSGHTDNTGNPPLNQTLSLKRAEAVRNWMRDTGDVPESCFAVQGYGENRPVATNDTAEGRALNRRVEISLVPQADACQVPGVTKTSSQDDDVTEN